MCNTTQYKSVLKYSQAQFKIIVFQRKIKTGQMNLMQEQSPLALAAEATSKQVGTAATAKFAVTATVFYGSFSLWHLCEGQET